MIFQHPLFLVGGLCGAVFLLVGALQYRFPPRRVNGVYGYRTARSMKGQAQWDFAQRFSASEMMKVGAIQVLLAIAGSLFRMEEKSGSILGVAVLVLGTVWLVARVERAIRRRFGDN